MLSQEDLIEIDGWERDHYGDYICEWVRELDEDEAKDNYEAFILTVQQMEDDQYNVSIGVSFNDGQVGDLLSADYADEVTTMDKAMERGRELVEEVEEDYDLN